MEPPTQKRKDFAHKLNLSSYLSPSGNVRCILIEMTAVNLSFLQLLMQSYDFIVTKDQWEEWWVNVIPKAIRASSQRKHNNNATYSYLLHQTDSDIYALGLHRSYIYLHTVNIQKSHGRNIKEQPQSFGPACRISSPDGS